MIINTILAKFIGTQNQRELKRIAPLVAAINAKEPEVAALTDERLKAKTAELRQRVAGGASRDDVLVEAFAVVREAGRRVLGMRHFDVQLVGGIVLHRGKIAEMKTGEGKTLVATLPAYLNALADFMHFTLVPSPPSLAIDMSDAVLTSTYVESAQGASQVVCVESEFQLEDQATRLRGFFLLLPDPPSLKRILTTIKVA